MNDSPTRTEEVLCEQPVAHVARNRVAMGFRRLLEAMPAAAYICDADGLITYFNQRAVKAWGREPKRHDPLDRY